MERHAHDLQAILDEQTIEDSASNRSQRVTVMGTIKSFKWQFWLLNLVIFLAYSTFIPFFANISMLLRYCFGFTLVESGELMALSSLTVTVLCPLIGYLSDKIQRRGTLLVLATFISCATQGAILAMPY